jgi:ElaB/YqjD/DUF883 family membrane-anchored ribosome-binding protein
MIMKDTRHMNRRLRRLLRDAEDFLEHTSDELGDRVQDARGRLAGSLKSAKATCQHWEDKAVEELKAADRYVHRRPYPFLGTAFGIGLLVGLVLHGNGQRRKDR